MCILLTLHDAVCVVTSRRPLPGHAGPDDVVICESIVHYILYTIIRTYVLPVLYIGDQEMLQ